MIIEKPKPACIIAEDENLIVEYYKRYLEQLGFIVLLIDKSTNLDDLFANYNLLLAILDRSEILRLDLTDSLVKSWKQIHTDLLVIEITAGGNKSLIATDIFLQKVAESHLITDYLRICAISGRPDLVVEQIRFLLNPIYRIGQTADPNSFLFPQFNAFESMKTFKTSIYFDQLLKILNLKEVDLLKWLQKCSDGCLVKSVIHDIANILFTIERAIDLDPTISLDDQELLNTIFRYSENILLILSIKTLFLPTNEIN